MGGHEPATLPTVDIPHGQIVEIAAESTVMISTDQDQLAVAAHLPDSGLDLLPLGGAGPRGVHQIAGDHESFRTETMQQAQHPGSRVS